MEAETTLVRAQCRVELHTVSTVDVNVTIVIFPGDTELDDTLRNGNDGQAFPQFGLQMEEFGLLEGRDELCRVYISTFATLKNLDPEFQSQSKDVPS